VSLLCRTLKVGRSAYYAYLAGREAALVRRDAEDELAGEIRRIHVGSRGAYGSPRVTAALRREHIRRFGVAPGRRLFRNGAGNYVEAAAYGITRGRAREAVFTLDEHALELAKRPYDLRHAGISFWLASGVDPAECARRAGQSIQVLFRYYAKFLAEAENHANSLIEDSMRRWAVARH
jgi:hypothetical protein